MHTLLLLKITKREGSLWVSSLCPPKLKWHFRIFFNHETIRIFYDHVCFWFQFPICRYSFWALPSLDDGVGRPCHFPAIFADPNCQDHVFIFWLYAKSVFPISTLDISHQHIQKNPLCSAAMSCSGCSCKVQIKKSEILALVLDLDGTLLDTGL